MTQAKTEWDQYVESRLAAGEDFKAIASSNFRGLMPLLIDHHQSVVSPIFLAESAKDRYFLVNEDDQVAEANYNSRVLGALADLMSYSVTTSRRIEMTLAVFNLYKSLEARPNRTEFERGQYIATRGMLDVEIEDAVSRLHNYREKVANCLDIRGKYDLQIPRGPNSQGVGFKEVYLASREVVKKRHGDKYLRMVLGEKFNNNKVTKLIVFRHGVTHGVSPGFGRGKRPPTWELNLDGEPVEVQTPADISFDELMKLITDVWHNFILGSDQLFRNEWI